MVEHLLAMQRVAGSNPVSRSFFMAPSPSGKAVVCKITITGSNPVGASTGCLGGGTGRHKGLKIPWSLAPCGFESRPRHFLIGGNY